MQSWFSSHTVIWLWVFELFLSVSAFSIPIYVSVQNGVSVDYIGEISSWNEEFWDSLGGMWELFPTRPVYMMIAKGNFGAEMGLTVSYPDSFRVLIEIRYPISEMRATVAHELMHVFQFAWMKRYRKMMPLWVMEGLATWYGGEKGTYLSPIGSNPFLFWSVNVLKYREYPAGQEAMGEYYSEVYALFNAINAKVNLNKNLPVLLKDVRNGDTWQEAFSDVLGESFDKFYDQWREHILFIVIVKFASFWALWIGLPLILIVFFLIRYIKRYSTNGANTINDGIENLEELYGKDYWKNDGYK